MKIFILLAMLFTVFSWTSFAEETPCTTLTYRMIKTSADLEYIKKIASTRHGKVAAKHELQQAQAEHADILKKCEQISCPCK